MLSKLTLLGASSAFSSMENRDLMRHLKNPKPRVTTTDCTDASYAVTRLKKGPANISEVKASFLSSGTKWSDTEWTDKDVLFKSEFTDDATKTAWNAKWDNNLWTY